MWGSISSGAAEDLITSSSAPAGEVANLHEILHREKLQFEEKLERAARRRRWLAGRLELLVRPFAHLLVRPSAH